MSEFSIERPPTASEPRRNVSSSEQTDADGGGGTTFIFHGGGDGGGDAEKQQQQRPHAPTSFGPPVELSLSGVAKVEIGYGKDPGDFGKIGQVLPPEGLSGSLAKNLEDAQRLEEKGASEGDEPNPEAASDSPKGQRDGSSGGLLKMLV